MKDKILIKKFGNNIYDELKSINFSNDYINISQKKFVPLKLKFLNLKPAEANILKQTCLSLGFDAAINRDAVTCKCDKSDALVCANLHQIEKLAEKLKKQPFRFKSLAEDLEKIIIIPEKKYIIKNKSFDFNKTYLMGILNVTPDSFSDGNKFFDTEKAISAALEMDKNGAAIIDIGGESTRPNSSPISWKTECDRILPVVSKIKQVRPNVLISIDTIHPETIVKALECGADILNTVDKIEKFEPVFDVLKKTNTPIVIT
ncbi:dihydropteroate synthase, partial [bacterium]|nr:dihydropteroate synthase [bacterium]